MDSNGIEKKAVTGASKRHIISKKLIAKVRHNNESIHCAYGLWISLLKPIFIIFQTVRRIQKSFRPDWEFG